MRKIKRRRFLAGMLAGAAAAAVTACGIKPEPERDASEVFVGIDLAKQPSVHTTGYLHVIHGGESVISEWGQQSTYHAGDLVIDSTANLFQISVATYSNQGVSWKKI